MSREATIAGKLGLLAMASTKLHDSCRLLSLVNDLTTEAGQDCGNEVIKVQILAVKSRLAELAQEMQAAVEICDREVGEATTLARAVL